MSELHNRLEYLISYSSQLIFVGCDSVSQQQSTLQHIVSLQHDDTEIAYLTGDQNDTDQSYRKEIYQQLTNDIPIHGFKLSDGLINKLSPSSGPVLICICEADFISDDFLSELWDLVNQNKEHESDHHLNVILFAQAAWTHRAKSVLSAKHSQTPILLSTQTVSAGSGLSEFELIRQNRERMQRGNQVENQQSEELSIIQQPWFKLLSGALFIALFGLIVFWQYPDEIRQFINPTYTDEKTQTTANANTPQDRISDEKTTEQQTTIESQAPQDTLPSPTKLSEDKNDVASQQSEDNPLDSALGDDAELVTNWQDEVEKLNSSESQATPQGLQDDSAADNTTIGPEPDIAATDTTSPTDLATLEGVEPGQFLLQLTAMSDPASLAEFESSNNLQNQTWRYTTQRFGGDWHVLLLAQSFGSLQEARDAVLQLPDTIDKGQPFAKSIEQIRKEQQE